MKHEMTQWKCFVQTHLLSVTMYGLCGALQWPLNIRWRWCTPMCHWLRHITLSSNVCLYAEIIHSFWSPVCFSLPVLTNFCFRKIFLKKPGYNFQKRNQILGEGGGVGNEETMLPLDLYLSILNSTSTSFLRIHKTIQVSTACKGLFTPSESEKNSKNKPQTSK